MSENRPSNNPNGLIDPLMKWAEKKDAEGYDSVHVVAALEGAATRLRKLGWAGPVDADGAPDSNAECARDECSLESHPASDYCGPECEDTDADGGPTNE